MGKDISNPLNFSDAYRSLRSKTSIFCGLGLAWSAAQFEISKISLGGVGANLNLSGIPVLLAFCVIYSFTRCTIEFAMQPKELRRLQLAQIDYRLSLELVRATLLMLAASGLSRSVSTAVYVLLSVLAYLVASFVLQILVGMALIPVMVLARKLQNRSTRTSIWLLLEAEGWAKVLVVFLAVIAVISLAWASLYYPAIHNLWLKPPAAVAVWTVAFTSCCILISFFVQKGHLDNLFALVEEDKGSGVTTYYYNDGRVKGTTRKEGDIEFVTFPTQEK